MNSFESKKPNENILRKAEIHDIPIIFSLLRENLAKNLTQEEKSDGFLYYEPTTVELEKIIHDTGIYLSLQGTELKGYLMTMSKELALSIPFERELVENAERMTYEEKPLGDYRYAILAQICIAKKFRNGMTFNRLHVSAQSALKDFGFELGVGEIEDTNTTSRAVHKYLSDIGTYTATSGLKWHVMVADLRKD